MKKKMPTVVEEIDL